MALKHAVTTKETAIMSKSGITVRIYGKILAIGMTTLLLKGNVALADELICDYEHKCYSGSTRPPPPQIYHMDPTHPDKETPPPAPQYPGVVPKPYVAKPSEPVAPPEIAETPPVTAEVPMPMHLYNPNPDCENMRHGLFPTPEAAAAARIHCGEVEWYPQ
jgi:hypothetical protein